MILCDCGTEPHEPFCAVFDPPTPDVVAIARAILDADPLDAVQTIGAPALRALAEHVVANADGAT